tara:strand:- start:1247 stop:1447 length:201 start_codon:yes stop_codon:yes gene_type:complete
MNKQELKELIDLEVSKVFSNMTTKEPSVESETETTQDIQSVIKKIPVTEDELDEILFYGKQNKKAN